MRFYAAPMEGVTGYLYRRAHHESFPGTDRYFIPFIAPKKTGHFTNRELRDIAPELNRGVPAVPQVLTNDAEAFLYTAELLEELGYGEVNLNLGCPSPTVVTKHKGAGFLEDPERLDRFFKAVFSRARAPVSVKTRIGLSSYEEAEALLAVYNRYPIAELIVHPRLGKDGYRGPLSLEIFGEWLGKSRNPVIYNGDIFRKSEYNALMERFPGIAGVMLGRGLQSNPALIRELQGGGPLTKKELVDFTHKLSGIYAGYFEGEKTLLYKLKEMWFYESRMFKGHEPYLKKIQKASSLGELRITEAALFRELELDPAGGYQPEHGGKMP